MYGEYFFFVTYISIQQLEYTIELVKSTFRKLEGVHELHESVFDQQSMLLLLKKELSSYSIFDFMKVQAFFDKDCRDLPTVYNAKFKKNLPPVDLTRTI